MSALPLLTILLTLVLCFFIAEFVATKTAINKPLSYLLVGFLISELFTRNGIDIILRADNFSILAFQGLLPLILFEMTLSLVKTSRIELAKCSALAIYMLIVFVPLASTMVYFMMDQPDYFPPIAALLSIAVIAAVEPACSRLNITTVKLSEPIRSQIEVETVISDALAAVLFSFTLIFATRGFDFNELGSEVFFALFQLILGGLFSGLLLGYLSVFIVKICTSKISYLLLSLMLAYGSYFLAEAMLGASGVVAVLSAGIVFRLKVAKAPFFKPLKSSWNDLGYFADAGLFLLLGMTFTVEMFTERWLAMFIIIFALITGKCVAGLSGYWLFIPYRHKSTVKPTLNSIILGNYNGALAVALVLSLPVELSYWWTTQAMVFGVVLYSVVIQLPIFTFINRRLR